MPQYANRYEPVLFMVFSFQPTICSLRSAVEKAVQSLTLSDVTQILALRQHPNGPGCEVAKRMFESLRKTVIRRPPGSTWIRDAQTTRCLFCGANHPNTDTSSITTIQLVQFFADELLGKRRRQLNLTTLSGRNGNLLSLYGDGWERSQELDILLQQVELSLLHGNSDAKRSIQDFTSQSLWQVRLRMVFFDKRQNVVK